MEYLRARICPDCDLPAGVARWSHECSTHITRVKGRLTRRPEWEGRFGLDGVGPFHAGDMLMVRTHEGWQVGRVEYRPASQGWVWLGQDGRPMPLEDGMEAALP